MKVVIALLILLMAPLIWALVVDTGGPSKEKTYKVGDLVLAQCTRESRHDSDCYALTTIVAVKGANYRTEATPFVSDDFQTIFEYKPASTLQYESIWDFVRGKPLHTFYIGEQVESEYDHGVITKIVGLTASGDMVATEASGGVFFHIRKVKPLTAPYPAQEF
jgi:hypothetical protein